MNETDLREIGVNSLGARRKFLSTIQYYQTRSNYYRINDEFLVNAWISRYDLAELKKVWSEMNKTVRELRKESNSVHVEHLVKQMQHVEVFFNKY